MSKSLGIAIAGIATAIIVTTTMDATGYANFSAFILLPIGAFFWWLQGFSKSEIGLVWGEKRYYAAAVIQPVAVLLAIAGIAWIAGAVDATDANWRNVAINVVAGSTIGVPIVVLTEEGFFRGWLWHSLKHAGLGSTAVLWTTSILFTLWHLSAIVLETGFNVPLAEVPIYLVNATLLGLTWGLLRQASGSVVVASVCHAVWNSMNYPLFGYGQKVGQLGIEETHIFGPEVGFVGIIMNSIAIGTLWWWIRKQDEAGGG